MPAAAARHRHGVHATNECPRKEPVPCSLNVSDSGVG